MSARTRTEKELDALLAKIEARYLPKKPATPKERP